MLALVWASTLLLVAAAAHLGGGRGRGKRGVKQLLLDGACTVVLRSAHLVFAIHQLFQAWVQSSLTQAGRDVQELLQADDTDAMLEKRQALGEFLASLPQRPGHLAAVLPEAGIREHEPCRCLSMCEIDDVEALCAWGLLAKVPRLSIYTRDGSLERSFDSIVGRLRDSKMAARAFGGRTPAIRLESRQRTECLWSGREAQPDIHIALWSRRDGYPSLVELSRELTLEAQKGALSPSDITEACVANRLQDPHGHGHPDLVLLFDNVACIAEFPPWQLQDSELVQAGSAFRSVGDAFCHALASYSKIQRRWGQ
ncbi:hypothetical protein GGF46_003622 [Coemansia sp. RSA 552]|nr:hypothetical protein GGF46_003622 [Coemansia sp. RSA 552]